MVWDIRGRARAMMPATNKMTKATMNLLHTIYVQNLSGSRPSTTAHPLPVGIRTGTLKAGATKRQINQYKSEVFNDVLWSGFIEHGTVHMTARRPLGDAVDQTGQHVPGEMNQVMVSVWRAR
jgi:hypothetical protein